MRITASRPGQSGVHQLVASCLRARCVMFGGTRRGEGGSVGYCGLCARQNVQRKDQSRAHFASSERPP